jgi:hypothetical protein
VSRRLARILGVSLLLLSAGEVLLLQWAWLSFAGSGLSVLGAAAALVALGAFNFAALAWSRRCLRANSGMRLIGRTWLLGSVAALLAGILLAGVFVLAGGGVWFFGGEALVRPTLAWLGGASVLLAFGSVLWGASVGDRRVRVDRVDLRVAKLAPENPELRIAQISDLHIGPLLGPERVREFVERIRRVEPDLIVITGDIFDFDPAYVEEGCRALAGLHAPHGVYAVLGNHDVYTGAGVVADGLAHHTGIRLLRDEWELLSVGRTELAVAGVEDSGQGWTERESENLILERLAGEIPDRLPSLLLAHRPSYFGQAARLGFSVVLSGHTHGGQVALPLAHHYNPSRLISHWTRGVFRAGESTLYVSRGLGMAGLPLRINCPREITLLHLAPVPG